MAKIINPKVGQFLRDLRKERGYSLQEVASGALIDFGYLSRVERALATPSHKQVTDLLAVLGASIEDMPDAFCPTCKRLHL